MVEEAALVAATTADPVLTTGGLADLNGLTGSGPIHSILSTFRPGDLTIAGAFCFL
jgi:hypothetical protein